MRLAASIAATLLIAGGATVARADDASLAAKPILLGAMKGVAYYTVEPDGLRVVATLASHESAPVVRVVGVLADGQKILLSVPRGVGENELQAELVRVGDRILVRNSQSLTQ